jgi:hypothetical protein
MSDAGEIIKSGAVDKLADLIQKLAGPMAEELGLMMGDKVRVYRIKNWVNVAGKTDKILKAAGLPPNAVPPRMFIPILEASSIERDEGLQDLWAGLLASASAESDSLSPSFIETLKQLTPSQAIALESLYDYGQAQTEYLSGRKQDLSEWFYTSVGGEMVAESFERLGIIRRQYDLQSPDKANPMLVSTYRALYLAQLDAALVDPEKVFFRHSQTVFGGSASLVGAISSSSGVSGGAEKCAKKLRGAYGSSSQQQPGWR